MARSFFYNYLREPSGAGDYQRTASGASGKARGERSAAAVVRAPWRQRQRPYSALIASFMLSAVTRPGSFRAQNTFPRLKISW